MNAAMLVAVLVPGIVAAALIAILLRTSSVRHLADHPNERSLHSQPTPRIGGLGIAAGFFPIAMVWSTIARRLLPPTLIFSDEYLTDIKNRR